MAASDRQNTTRIVIFWAYYQSVCARAWRDTLKFTKAQIVTGLVLAVMTAVTIYSVSADIGEPFNVRVAIYATVVASLAVVLVAFAWNMLALPWRLHKEQADVIESQAARIAEFERRPDVRPLVALREHGIQLLNRPVSQNEEQLADWVSTLRAWEDETAAELEKYATKIDASEFRVLGTLVPRVFPGVITVHQGEMTMLAERLERLAATIRRIEGGAGQS